jgi:hypothetical protein
MKTKMRHTNVRNVEYHSKYNRCFYGINHWGFFFSCSIACFQKHKSSGNKNYLIKIGCYILIEIETCVEQNLPVIEGEQRRYSIL